MKRPLPAVDSIYERIANEEDARVCTDITDDACRYVPVNFFMTIASQTLTKLGDELSSAKTVLAWLMVYTGAPAYLIGFLVPIRESGSMLPQLFIARYVRSKPVRKWVWVAGSVLQFFAVAGIGAAAYSLSGKAAGWAIIALLILFSLSRGLCSVAAKDVLGKTIPKTRRGLLTGLSVTISGVLTLGVGLWFLFRSGEASPSFYALLLLSAAVLWLAAAAVYAFIQEFPGETSGGGDAAAEAFKSLAILKTDRPFRRFVTARALLLCSALSAPFYVVIAQDAVGAGASLLGMFIVAQGLATSLSATVWGKTADRSSRRVMLFAGTISGALGMAVFCIVTYLPAVAGSVWLYPAAFFMLGVAHSGVRIGRKTYIVDLAGGKKRTDYVAVSNTVIGLVLLVAGFVGALSAVLSPAGVILVLSAAGLAGVILGKSLPEAE